jgi:hypothetical protein
VIYDLVVIGGGSAGAAAAISAGRRGLKTLLVESGGCLGGILTSGLVCYVLDAQGKGGLLGELRGRLADKQAIGHQYEPKMDFTVDPETAKAVLESLCSEAGVELLYYTTVVEAERDPAKLSLIRSVGLHSAGRRWKAEARYFIDASGQGDTAELLGLESEIGHPRSGKLQPASMEALVSGVPPDYDFTLDGNKEDKLKLKALLEGVGAPPTYGMPLLIRLSPGGAWLLAVNHQYGVDPRKPETLTQGTVAARAELLRAATLLREKAPGWQNFRVLGVSEKLALREGRRIAGEYRLTADDLLSGRRFDDGICLVHFPVDIHALDPEDPAYGKEGISAQPYHIPYRALVAKGMDNLALAGRCISGDFFAHASYRVVGNTIAMGEALGCAISRACAQASGAARVPLRDVDGKSVSKWMKERGYTI